MASLKDESGYNQMFVPTKALRVRTKKRCDFIISKLGKTQGSKILEIGCGTGELSYLLAKNTNAEILGSDISKKFVFEASQKYQFPRLTFETIDFNSTDILLNRKFDYVVGNGILHHLYFNIDKVLTKIFLMLNENGKIIFLEPNLLNPYCFAIFKFSYFRKLAKLEPGEMAFTKSFISKKLSVAGYSQISVEYRDFLLPNTPESLIKPTLTFGSQLEKIPMVKYLSQSIFISADKPKRENLW